MPEWTAPLLLQPRASLRRVKYLLTFRPFQLLPAAVQRAYLAGELHLLPFPGSLVFWGTAPYHQLQQEFPFAAQIPLLHLFARHENPRGIRVLQSGWLHEPRPGQPEPNHRYGPVRNTYKRHHRWARIHRYEDELAVLAHEDRMAHVLFSSKPDDLGLYGKPMARNAQIWTHDWHLLLDGPQATRDDLDRAESALAEGGLFGYRFLFPAMRVGGYEVFWHRPLVAYLDHTGQPALLPSAPLGYLTAYDAVRPDLAHPIELWPRLLQRSRIWPRRRFLIMLMIHVLIRRLTTSASFSTHCLLGRPLPPVLARRLLNLPRHQTLTEWLDCLPQHSLDPERTHRLVDELRQGLAEPLAPPAETLTFRHTARRSFEIAYWRTIAFLAHGWYLTKNNADCVRDPATQQAQPHHRRDLDELANYLIRYYTGLIRKHQLTGQALAGELPFPWQTDFRFPWMGGWLHNQEGKQEERDVVVVIPGRDRGRAVIMADHYDTAFMADRYEKNHGGNGARLAAAGADDNHSATAALMLGAPIFMELSRAGKLACDVWLVHLTGEEFPADCLGARHLCQCLVEGRLKIRLPEDVWHDLSAMRVQGVYVLDMIAHNNDHESDVFQIAPGTGGESLELAYLAHGAAEAWNAGTPGWNRRPSRRGRHQGQRSPDGSTIPEVALHPELIGEVRLPYDVRSTLYNTDGQIFSDAGVPVVLFMENYDINRVGYHDTHDTLENIDLDYGAALAAITIETVARAAQEKTDSVG